MRSTSISRLTGGAVIAATAVALALAGPGSAATAAPGDKNTPNGPTIDIQLLSFNDFHGNLEPPSGSSGRLVLDHTLAAGATRPADVTTDTLTPPGVGGVEYLATHLAAGARGRTTSSLTVAAGDLIGASPLLSGAFHDEPIDRGAQRAQARRLGGRQPRVRRGLRRAAAHGERRLHRRRRRREQPELVPGRHIRAAPISTTSPPTSSTRARARRSSRRTRSRRSKGAKIGFIGMTLKDTPDIVTAAGIAGLEFKDEVATANALVPVLKAKGVNAIVVLIHQGGVPGRRPGTTRTTTLPGQPVVRRGVRQRCGAGPDQPDHPDRAGPRPGDRHDRLGAHARSRTSAASRTRRATTAWSRPPRRSGACTPTRTLTYDRRTQDIVRTSVTSANVLVTRNVPKDQAETESHRQVQDAGRADRERGDRSDHRRHQPRGERGRRDRRSGDLIADAQLADPSVIGPYAAPQIALMNPGGIRTDLTLRRVAVGRGAGRRHLRGGVQRPAVQQLPGLARPHRRRRSSSCWCSSGAARTPPHRRSCR